MTIDKLRRNEEQTTIEREQVLGRPSTVPLTSLFEFVAADDPICFDDEWHLLADRRWHIQVISGEGIVEGETFADDHRVVHFVEDATGRPAIEQHGMTFGDLRAAMHYCATLQANSIS